MTPAIQQSAKFVCSPKELFEMYIDSAKHTAATGMPARMSRRAGGKFTAFGERLRGSNLLVIPNRMVVQAWRSSGWRRGEPDSILVLEFTKLGRGSHVDLVHVGVPAHDHQGVTNGWPKYYWEPWKRYLQTRGAKRGRRARA